MESNRSKPAEDQARCPEDAEAPPDVGPEALGDPRRDLYELLDEIRAQFAENPAPLFKRRAVGVEYLRLLAQAGVLRSKGRLETNCRIDEHGELLCVHSGAPGLDCRVPACTYHALMRARIDQRLAIAYAHARKKHVAL